MTMTKRTRQSIIEPLMLEKLTAKAITQHLIDVHNVTVTSETVRRGFDHKDKSVTVREANAARKDLAGIVKLTHHRLRQPKDIVSKATSEY